MLKLELGKYYKDRLGKVWGPLTRTPPERHFACTHPFHAGGRTFREDGTYGVSEGVKTHKDLVEEYPPKPTFKPGDHVRFKKDARSQEILKSWFGPVENAFVVSWTYPQDPVWVCLDGNAAYLHRDCIEPIPAETPWYPDDSGDWIEHDGKGCPVPPDTEVQVLLEAERKNKTGLVTRCVNSARDWDKTWRNDALNPIVAYKLAEPKPAPKPQAAPKPAPVAVSSGRIARYFVISREGVVYCYTSLRAAQKAARGFAIAAPGRPYTIAVFVETISSKER